MKKICLAMVILTLLFIRTIPVSALDLGGYLENKFQVLDGQNMAETNKLKLDFKSKAGNYYLFASLTGLNDFLNPQNDFLKISRAYLELYPSWGKATIGQQNIAWGDGYLFNLPDQFNLPNPLDPKGEKDGINAISVKWNTTGTSLMEVALIPAKPPGVSQANLAGIDYGMKGLWNIGRFDIGIYGLRKTITLSDSPPYPYMDRRAAVLELKGELGDGFPGVWAQGGWFYDIQYPAAMETAYISSVFGADYTFAVGNGLYVLAEYFQNGKMANNQLYFLTRYGTTGYLALSLSGLWVLQTNNALYSLALKYQLNDNVELFGMANYYPQGSTNIGLTYNCTSEFVIGLKTSF
jgi:hypothetical protein